MSEAPALIRDDVTVVRLETNYNHSKREITYAVTDEMLMLMSKLLAAGSPLSFDQLAIRSPKLRTALDRVQMKQFASVDQNGSYRLTDLGVKVHRAIVVTTL